MTLAQVFIASLGLGFGMNVAKWATLQLAGFINTAVLILHDRTMRERVVFSTYCAVCAGPCDTIFRCSSPACGYVHEPSAEAKP